MTFFGAKCAFLVNQVGEEVGERTAVVRVTQKDVLNLPIGKHRVDDGLYIRVQASGRSFILRYQKDGKRHEVGIGSATTMTIARAKEVARKIKFGIGEGVEPTARKVQQSAGRTFNEVFREAVEVTDQVRQWKNEKHRYQWTRNIELHVCPTLGDRPIAEIGRDDIIEVLTPIWTKLNPTAVKIRGRLERVFAYAIFRGEYDGPNPAVYRGNLDMVLAPPSKVHEEKHLTAMTLEDTKDVCAEFWKRGRMSHMVVIFGILTALRAGEFVRARWSEIDWKNRIFMVPPERRKVARPYPHRVPLSDQAMAVLERLKEFDPEMTGFIFKSPVIEGDCVDVQLPQKILLKYFKRPVTMHGCRSTFRDWAEETGQNSKAAERALMHDEPNKVTRAYQRSDLLDLRRPLMQAWADEVLPIVKCRQICPEE